MCMETLDKGFSHRTNDRLDFPSRFLNAISRIDDKQWVNKIELNEISIQQYFTERTSGHLSTKNQLISVPLKRICV